MHRLPLAALAAAAALTLAAPAAADNWLPHPSGATWSYAWSDSAYSPTPTIENVTVQSRSGSSFVLAWTTGATGSGSQTTTSPTATAPTTTAPTTTAQTTTAQTTTSQATTSQTTTSQTTTSQTTTSQTTTSQTPTSQGTVSFDDEDSGLYNTDWSGTPPPSNMPILCASASNCGNSLSSTYYDIIWGSRAPVLQEPLVQGASWSGTGGADNDVAGTSTYLGQQHVTVPAFSKPVTAAVVRTSISQAGALGDPYGSGIRTVWWVYGVGPVKVVFDHAGGAGAPVTTSVLQSTSLTPAPPPTDVVYFPLTDGLTQRYSWTNTKYLKKPEVEQVAIQGSADGSARFTVTSVSGPIRVSASYGYTSRVSGVTNLWASSEATTLVKFPPLGPVFAKPANRRHFFTPFDLMDFGFNPVLAAYPARGDTWSSSRNDTDFQDYGVTGTSRILGVQTVRVPAGTFKAIVVRSTLKQPGFPFGSGTRTCWFAPGKGLVKLVFDHADGSVSTVVLIPK